MRVNPCDLPSEQCIGSRAGRRAFYLQSSVRKLKFCRFSHVRAGGSIEYIKTTYKDDGLIEVPAEARCAVETCPNSRTEFDGAIILDVDCIESFDLRTTQTQFETMLSQAAAPALDEELIEEEGDEE